MFNADVKLFEINFPVMESKKTEAMIVGGCNAYCSIVKRVDTLFREKYLRTVA